MDDNFTDISLFDQYLSGAFNPAEKADFEQRLKTDSVLSESYDFHQKMLKGIRVFDREMLKKNISSVATKLETSGFFLDEDDITNYLDGSISPKQKTLLEKRVQTDQTFAEKLTFEKSLLKGIKQADKGDLKKSIAAAQQKLETTGFFKEKKSEKNKKEPYKDTKKKNNLIPLWKKYGAIAAGILFLISTYWVYPHLTSSTYTTDQIYANSFEQGPKAEDIFSAHSIRGNSEEIALEKQTNFDLWKKARQAYEQKDFANALNFIQSIDLDVFEQKEQAELFFHQGLLNMLNENHEKAYTLFEKSQYSPSRKAWYQALLLLKMKKPREEVVFAFETIAKSPTNRYNEEAANVLIQLQPND